MKTTISPLRSAPWLIVIAALLWSIDAPFRTLLTHDLSSTTIVLLEHILILFFVLPILIRRRHEYKKLSPKHWLALLFIGVCGSALGLVFFTQAFRYVNPSVAILLQKTQPFIAIGLAVWILKEVLPKRFYVWAFIAIIGAYLTAFPEIIPHGISFSGNILGVIYALLAAFFWGASTVFGRYVITVVSWPMITAIRFFIALIFLFILNIYTGTLGELLIVSKNDLLYVFITALIVGLLAQIIYYRGLVYTRASIATIGELMFPVAAVVVNWVFLDATLTTVQLLGGGIMLIAMFFVSRTNDTFINKE